MWTLDDRVVRPPYWKTGHIALIRQAQGDVMCLVSWSDGAKSWHHERQLQKVGPVLNKILAIWETLKPRGNA